MAQKGNAKKTGADIVNEQRRHVVDKIITDMQERGFRWAEPYLASMRPQNPVTGTIYQGGNRIHLAFAAAERGYSDNRWCTFNQIKKAGWTLKKGSEHAIIEKWKEVHYKVTKDKNGDPIKDSDGNDSFRIVSRLMPIGYWSVYNASCINGIPELDQEDMHVSDNTAEIADRLIKSSRCRVILSASPFDAASSYYVPSKDVIRLPARESFRSDETFTRTLLHEMTHSTGHESALNRPIKNGFGSPEYAKEELVAELGSLFLSSDLGIQAASLDDDMYANHVAYLQSWLHALEDNPDYLFTAASAASKADAYIMDRYDKCLEAERPVETSLSGTLDVMAKGAAELSSCTEGPIRETESER